MIRMLVITSDRKLNDTVVEHFTSNGGFEVWGANAVDEAIGILDREGVINVLIAEVGNPDMDGTNLILQFRRRLPSLPCIALASSEDDETRQFLESQGILRYRQLPVENEDLDRLVNEVLDEARSLGFQGHLQRISLIDVIQLYCATGKTGRLDILHWGKRGAIYFASGKLLHAVQGELEGQEAFYRLVAWDSGTFRVEFGVLPSIDTLGHESLHALLIEAIRRQDEARARSGTEVLTRVETPDRSGGRAAPSSPPELELLENEPAQRRRLPVLKAQLVNDLLAVDGVEGLIVVNRSGVVLQVEDVEDSEETLATLTTFVGSSCEAAQRALEADRFKTALIVERSQRKLLVVNTRNFYVGVVASAHAAVDGVTREVVDCIRQAATGKDAGRGRRGRPPALTPADLGSGSGGDPEEDSDA
jgi:CheY-like chemotaxis protein